jgi:hypothetical protein
VVIRKGQRMSAGLIEDILQYRKELQEIVDEHVKDKAEISVEDIHVDNIGDFCTALIGFEFAKEVIQSMDILLEREKKREEERLNEER